MHLLQSTDNSGLIRSRGDNRQVVSKRMRNGSRDRVTHMLKPNTKYCIKAERADGTSLRNA